MFYRGNGCVLDIHHCLDLTTGVCFCRKKKGMLEQTDPPSIPIIDLFPSGNFPEGEIQQYKDE
jgi:hypothetical protein